MLFVEEATIDHAKIISGNLRKADLDELYAATGCPAMAVLVEGVQKSHRSYVILKKDTLEPVALYGVLTYPEDAAVGIVWMVATDELKNHARQFIKGCAEHIAKLGEGYKFLSNFVDARNSLHIKWLKAFGFKLEPEPMPYGFEGRPFYLFNKVMICANQQPSSLSVPL